jgi:hypothetical protein
MSDAYFNIGAGSGIVALVGAVGYGVYHLCLHSRCRSVCCSRPLLDLQVNLENNSPGFSTPAPAPVRTPQPEP